MHQSRVQESARPSGLLGNAARASLAPASTLLLATLLIIAGRMLGTEDYGKLTFALSLAMIFETVVDFGLRQVTTREVARDRDAASRLVGNMLGLKLPLAAVAALGLVLATHALSSEPDVRAACYLLGAASILRSYMLTVRHMLQGLERFGLDSIVVLVDRGLLLLLGVTALYRGLELYGLAASFVGARVLSLSAAWVLGASQVGRLRPAFDIAFWRSLQIQAAPFGAFVVVLHLYSYLDTIMLKVMQDNVETGIYGAAYRIYEGLSGLPLLIQVVLIPRLARHDAAGGAAHGRLSRAGLALGAGLAIPVTVAAVALAGWAVTTLFGSSYAPAATVLQVLATGFVFVFPLFVLYGIAVSIGAGVWMLRTAVSGCLANVALNAMLIPGYGAHGAAMATVASEALCVAVLAWGLRRQVWSVPGAGAA